LELGEINRNPKQNLIIRSNTRALY